MSVVELMRLMRLHQLNINLRLLTGKRQIANLAAEYHFDHMGRFAGYYKKMFGVSASKVKQTISHKK